MVEAYNFPKTDHAPSLIGQRLVLRALRASDLPEIFALFSDPKVMRYWGRLPMQNQQEAEALLADTHSGYSKQTLVQWGITLDDHNMIGTVALHTLNLKLHRGILSYALNPNYWRQGLAHEALLLALNFARRTLNLRRLEAHIDPRHQASIRLIERLKFRYEGLLPAYCQVGDEWQDRALYGLQQTSDTSNKQA